MVYESLAISQLENAQGRWGNLKIYYPSMTLRSDHPVALLNSDLVKPEQKKAAKLWIDTMRSPILQSVAPERWYGNKSASSRAEVLPAILSQVMGPSRCARFVFLTALLLALAARPAVAHVELSADPPELTYSGTDPTRTLTLVVAVKGGPISSPTATMELAVGPHGEPIAADAIQPLTATTAGDAIKIPIKTKAGIFTESGKYRLRVRVSGKGPDGKQASKLVAASVDHPFGDLSVSELNERIVPIRRQSDLGRTVTKLVLQETSGDSALEHLRVEPLNLFGKDTKRDGNGNISVKDVPSGGLTVGRSGIERVELELSGFDTAGTFTQRLSVTSPNLKAKTFQLTFAVSDGPFFPFLVILAGVLAGAIVQWLISKLRPRQATLADLADLRARLERLQRRVADRSKLAACGDLRSDLSGIKGLVDAGDLARANSAIATARTRIDALWATERQQLAGRGRIRGARSEDPAADGFQLRTAEGTGASRPWLRIGGPDPGRVSARRREGRRGQDRDRRRWIEARRSGEAIRRRQCSSAGNGAREAGTTERASRRIEFCRRRQACR